jgi:protein SCO1/2
MSSSEPPNAPQAAPPPRTWSSVSAREQIRSRYFPDVSLTDQNGTTVRFYEDLIKDKIVVLNFFYATCEGICVPITSNLAKVQAALGGRVGRDIFMYSFSLKPQLDTPAVLREYAARFHAGPGWQFLTGRPDDLELVRRRLGFTDPDPVRDADKTNHTGMIRYGNEPLTLWAACPGMQKPESLVKSILAVDWLGRQRAGRSRAT